MKTETKNTPTPLSRVQKRLGHWEEILKARLEAKNTMLVGQIAVAIDGDKALEAELVEKAQAAVADWETIVRMVETHGDLLGVCKMLREVLLSGEFVNQAQGAKLEAVIAKAEGR